MGAGYGDVAEQADAVDLKSTDFGHVDSNSTIATTDGYSLFFSFTLYLQKNDSAGHHCKKAAQCI